MSGIKIRPPRYVVVLALSAAISLPVTAAAQIEEIVVTARKKEESLQDVPISITAFSAEQLLERGIGSDNDVAEFTVNFNTLPQTGRDFDRPVIRGMASPSSRGEANAAYFIDGVYISGSIASATTSAVENVQVLRGPQSAQFGRGAFSGAINYVTKMPTNEFAGQMRSRAGTSDDYEIGGLISGPLIEDTLLFLLSADWSKYGGQWNNNLAGNEAFYQPVGAYVPDPPQGADHSRLGSEETTDFLAKLVWKPWDDAQVELKYGYTQTDDAMFVSQVAPPGPVATLVGPNDPRLGLNQPGPNGIYATLNCQLAPEEFYNYLRAGGSNLTTPFPGEQAWWRTSGGGTCGRVDGKGWENRVNVPDFESGVTMSDGRVVTPAEPGLRKHQNRGLFLYTQDFDGWKLTARGGANTEDYHQVFDLDHTETRAVFGLFNFDNYRDSSDWSSEIRLATPADKPVRAEVGAYYFDRRVTGTQRSIPGPSVVFGGASSLGLAPPSKRNVENLAFIGTFGWDITDEWQFELESRYASEEVRLRGGNGCEAKATYYSLTPRISMTFKPTEALRFYVQAANGDKPGDFNSEFFRGDVSVELCELAQIYTTDVAILPEEQWTYEIGAKTRWLDNRLQANLAVFYIDWTKQTIFQTQNFGAYHFPDYANDQTLVTTILRNVGDSRNIGGELETIFAVTDEFTLNASYGYTHAKFQNGFDSNLADLTGNGDVTGKWIPSAPESNYVLGAVIKKPVTDDWSASFRADYIYEGKRYSTPSNFAYIGAREILNLRAGIESSRWNVSAYIKNLMNDETPLAVLNFVNFGYGAIAPGADKQFGTNDDIYPNMNSVNPPRGRDYGVELQYKFGAN